MWCSDSWIAQSCCEKRSRVVMVGVCAVLESTWRIDGESLQRYDDERRLSQSRSHECVLKFWLRISSQTSLTRSPFAHSEG
jgi:hypothetical protein